MKDTRAIMGMPITVHIVDAAATSAILDTVFSYFSDIDARFSTFKETSEISLINRGEIELWQISPEMKEVFELSEKTKIETKGFFDIRRPDNTLDPSGLVKGWAIQNAAHLLRDAEFKDFCIEAGGDIQTQGNNEGGGAWRIGIRNPFEQGSVVKVVELSGNAIATSGTYLRGEHIYNPHTKQKASHDLSSISVIGESIYDADRFATAAFAMGKEGIHFIESLNGFEGYAIDSMGTAIFTTGFKKYCV